MTTRHVKPESELTFDPLEHHVRRDYDIDVVGLARTPEEIDQLGHAVVSSVQLAAERVEPPANAKPIEP